MGGFNFYGSRILPRNLRRPQLKSVRYEKHVPGHQVQVDVKFLKFRAADGKLVRRFQHTAIDDAARIRALKIYRRHTQKNAMSFVDYVIKKFPCRIHTIRTDNGHKFQAQFHWHVEDIGIRHVYIKHRSPRPNGKVERSHGSHEREFYQLFSYTDDVDLNRRLKEWERTHFYNFRRPHVSRLGKTSYDVLPEKLSSK